MKLFPHFTGDDKPFRFIYNEMGPSGGNDTGPLKVEHLKDITDEQKTDAEIHAALAKFNAKFQDQDFDLVLKYLDEVDEGDLTAADVSRLEEYAAQVEAKLQAKPVVAPVEPVDAEEPIAAVADKKPEVTDEKVVPPEEVEFAPDPDRCRACLVSVFGDDFTKLNAEVQGSAVQLLVDLEYDEGCPITEFSPDEIRDECSHLIVEAGIKEETADIKSETEEANEASEAMKEQIDQIIKSDSLTLSQVESALALDWSKASEEQKPYQGKLLTVKADLANVSGVAPADNPQEAALIQSIVTSTPVTWKAEQPTVRYASIIQQINAGQLSDDTKRRAIEALGVRFTPAPSPGSLSTGSNVSDALENGRGTERVDTGRTERVPDPDNPGQFIERPIYEDRPIPYTAEEPLEVREGVNAYPAENGDFIMTAQMPDGRVLRFNVGSDNINGEDIGRKINTAIVSMAFARKGNANINQQGLVADQGGQVIDINDIAFGAASQFSQNVMKHFVGGIAGRDGEILSSSDIKKVDRVAQWLSQEKGDFFGGEDGGHGRNDFTPAAPYLQQIGLINEDGSIGPEENFALIGAYVQPKIGTGNPDYNAVLQYYRSEKGIE